MGSPGSSENKPPITTAASVAATMSAAAVAAHQMSPAAAAAAAAASSGNCWQGRAIATQKLRLIEFSAFVDQQRADAAESFNKHLFVHIGGPVSYADPTLEVGKPQTLLMCCNFTNDHCPFIPQPIDVRQIQDKFPEKKGGLKDLYEKGPHEAFFLVKFWADLNTNISDEAGSFYGVTTTYEC